MFLGENKITGMSSTVYPVPVSTVSTNSEKLPNLFRGC